MAYSRNSKYEETDSDIYEQTLFDVGTQSNIAVADANIQTDCNIESMRILNSQIDHLQFQNYQLSYQLKQVIGEADFLRKRNWQLQQQLHRTASDLALTREQI